MNVPHHQRADATVLPSSPFATVIKTVQPLIYRLRGQARLAYYRDALETMPTTPDSLRAYQLNKLQKLVKHAYDTVPYYKRAFHQVGFEPEDLQSFDDFQKLPILTRDLVKENLPSMVSDRFNRSRLVYTSTGGSTGTPMNYYQSNNYLERSEGVLMRSFAWIGKMPSDAMLKFVGTRMGFDKGAFGPLKRAARFIAERTIIINAFDITPEDLSNAVSLIRLFRPSFYYGYASSVSFLATYVKDNRISLPPVRGVVTSAEKLYPEQKKLLEDTFRAPAYSFYACREVRNVAAMCRSGRMHQIADAVYSEFVQHPTLGTETHILLTPLESYAMPFIRYSNGDLASASTDSCDCGNGFPTMNVNVGRTTDMFLTPEGTWVHGEYFTHLLYGAEGIQRFQFHQTAADAITLHIVQGPEFDADSGTLLKQALATIHRDISANYRLSVNYVDEIPLSPVGKFLFTRSDIPQNSRGPVRGSATAVSEK